MAISVNFLDQQNTIIQYITDQYKNYLLEDWNLQEPDEYTSDFLDFDKHKLNFTVFFDFGGYTFTWKSNESEIQEIACTVYLVHRNDTQEMLRKNLLNSATAFYQMFDDMDDTKLCYFEGAADYGKISGINFYEWVEGNKALKVAEIELLLRKEI